MIRLRAPCVHPKIVNCLDFYWQNEETNNWWNKEGNIGNYQIKQCMKERNKGEEKLYTIVSY